MLNGSGMSSSAVGWSVPWCRLLQPVLSLGLVGLVESRKFKFTRIKIVVRKTLAASEAWLERSAFSPPPTRAHDQAVVGWLKVTVFATILLNFCLHYALVGWHCDFRYKLAKTSTELGRFSAGITHPVMDIKMPTAYLNALLVTHRQQQLFAIVLGLLAVLHNVDVASSRRSSNIFPTFRWSRLKQSALSRMQLALVRKAAITQKCV
jgi:hypothetical protein